MTVKSVTAATALIAALAAAPAQAAIIFSDSFDADNGASALNFNNLINWTIGNGTIDYIRSGGFGISCVGGTGGCVDMDGSTGDAGRITSKQVFTLSAGVTYWFEALVSGNQRGQLADSVMFGFINTDSSPGAVSIVGAITAARPFTLEALGWGPLVANEPGTYRLFIEGVGGDNYGVILDNVVFSDNRQAAVPEPATLLLASLGLLAAGAVRRRQGR